MFTLRKIHGNSLSPRLNCGDFVLVVSIYRSFKVGDLVVLQHPIYHRIIKKIVALNDCGAILLSGEHPSSLTSEQMGWIAPQLIEGKVLLSFRASPN